MEAKKGLQTPLLFHAKQEVARIVASLRTHTHKLQAACLPLLTVLKQESKGSREHQSRFRSAVALSIMMIAKEPCTSLLALSPRPQEQRYGSPAHHQSQNRQCAFSLCTFWPTACLFCSLTAWGCFCALSLRGRPRLRWGEATAGFWGEAGLCWCPRTEGSWPCMSSGSEASNHPPARQDQAKSRPSLSAGRSSGLDSHARGCRRA